MGAWHTLLSPLAGRALRALAPLAALAGVSLGMAAGVEMLVREPAQDRLRGGEAAYGAARHAQSEQLAVRRTEEALSATWELLMTRKQFPSLILAVTELARRDGVAIPGMSYALQNVDEGVAIKASMSFQVAGDYAAIRRFIHRLETNDRYFAVESLDASRSQKRLSVGRGQTTVLDQVRFNLRVTTFLKPDAPASLSET